MSDLSRDSQSGAGPEDQAEQDLGTALKVYLAALVFLAPCDYFRPTALVFREAGARPAILLMILATVWIFFRDWRYLLFSAPTVWVKIFRSFLWIQLLGTLAFIVNLFFGFSYTDGARTPVGQYLAQFPLFALVPFVLIAHASLFSRPGVVAYMLRWFPAALCLHLVVIGVEAVGILDPLKFPLDLFRPTFTVPGQRPAGLMTEPSYVGVLAGVYGFIICVLCKPKKRSRGWIFLLALAAVGTSLALGAKTIVPVMGASIVGYILQQRVSLRNPAILGGIAVVAALAIYNVLTFSALNVQENLSSAMRLGSAVLAWNVAKAGYGLVGVGFGQFHFMYQVRFAPWYLMYSEEAKLAFSHFADTRASTYNLFLRYLVETGVVGLAIFLGVILRLLVTAREHHLVEACFGSVLMCGSLGFLFTQDPYFFPMFLMGAAAILAAIPLQKAKVLA